MKLRISNSKQIEKECARQVASTIGSQGKKESIEVGVLVRQIVTLWKTDLGRAVAVAETAVREHPKSGDLRYFLGVTLMKDSRAREADASFAEASRLKSKRPELLENWILAKGKAEDWQGVLRLYRNVNRDHVSDVAFLAALKAHAQVGRAAYERKDWAKSIESCMAGISEADFLAKTHRVDRFDVRIRDIVHFASETVVYAAIQLHPNPEDYLRIFDAIVKIHRCRVEDSRFAVVAIKAICRWANAVGSSSRASDVETEISSRIHEVRDFRRVVNSASGSMSLAEVDGQIGKLEGMVRRLRLTKL